MDELDTFPRILSKVLEMIYLSGVYGPAFFFGVRSNVFDSPTLIGVLSPFRLSRRALFSSCDFSFDVGLGVCGWLLCLEVFSGRSIVSNVKVFVFVGV